VINELFARYRVPPIRSSDDFTLYCTDVLHCAVRDGLLHVARDGRPSKWKGQLGFELLEAVEKLQARTPTMTVTEVIKKLKTDGATAVKWGKELDLEKRYYDARKFWREPKRLMKYLGIPKNSQPKNSQ